MKKLTRKICVGDRLDATQRTQLTDYIDALKCAFEGAAPLETMEVGEAVILACNLRDIIEEMADETNVWLGEWCAEQRIKARKKKAKQRAKK